MQGYENNFDIALGLKETPLKTLKDIRHDEMFKKNRTLMDLVKQMLSQFKRWARIATLSAIKGLNPFSSDKNAVENGYYDYRNTAEFKQMQGMVAYQVGINKAYLREDILERYKVLHQMYQDKKNDISGLVLTEEGFFYDTKAERTVAVLTAEQTKALREFIASNPKYDNGRYIWYISACNEVVVDADNVAVKAFLEKEHLGRDFKSREKEQEEKQEEKKEEEKDKGSDKEQENPVPMPKKREVKDISGHVSPGDAFTDGVFEYALTMRDTVTLCRYVGEDGKVKMPESVVVNGTKYGIRDVMRGAFLGTPVQEIELNALYWQGAMYNPTYFVTGPESIPVMKWQNLTPEQEQQLDRNKQWAKEIQKDEFGIPVEDVDPQKQDKEPEKEEEPEQNPKPAKKDKEMDR